MNGANCNYTCDTGYTLAGSKRICVNGVLSGSAQTCSASSCNALTSTTIGRDNAVVDTCGTTVANGQTCSVVCIDHHPLVPLSWHG
jgi:hypothetical protein